MVLNRDEEFIFAEYRCNKFKEWRRENIESAKAWLLLISIAWALFLAIFYIDGFPTWPTSLGVIIFSTFTVMMAMDIVNILSYNKGLRMTDENIYLQGLFGREITISFNSIIDIKDMIGIFKIQYSKNGIMYFSHYNYSRVDSPARLRKLLKEKVSSFKIEIGDESWDLDLILEK